MIEGGFFNIPNSKPTNKDIIISFSPSIDTANYSYVVYKDDKAQNKIEIENNHSTDIYLTETGNYKIIVTTITINGDIKNIESGTYIIDKIPPTLDVGKKKLQLNKEDILLIEKDISANDNYDGNITKNIKHNGNNIDFKSPGNYKLVYTVSDSAGNKTSEIVNIEVLDRQTDFYILQSIILISLIVIFVLVIRFRRMLNLEKRLSPFTIESKQNNTPSLFDRILEHYHKSLKGLVKYFNKLALVKKYASKFHKYIPVSSLHNNEMEILAGKFVFSVAFVAIAIFAKTIQLKLISLYELTIPFIVGFFLLDIIYIVKYKFYRHKIENDLLTAIIVMNNSFKAGRSISQAIELVGKEIEGDIGKEFQKMSLELSYGLDISIIFKRFADRIQVEEVNYLTASLTILNKTGGNIIQVFSSIEKNLFNKKKLRLELKSLTSSSKIIVYVLFAVPFIFVIFISLISPNYFLPFITTDIGLILLGGMIIYYILFIYFVRKILKVVI